MKRTAQLGSGRICREKKSQYRFSISEIPTRLSHVCDFFNLKMDRNNMVLSGDLPHREKIIHPRTVDYFKAKEDSSNVPFD